MNKFWCVVFSVFFLIYNIYVRVYSSKRFLFRGQGFSVGSWGCRVVTSVGIQQDGIDVFQCLVVEDYVEVLYFMQWQQVYRLWLAVLLAGIEFGVACGYSVIIVFIEYIYRVRVGEVMVKDVGVGRGQVYVIQIIYFYIRCWEVCEQVT